MEGKEYDTIILGTGLKEGLLSGLLAVHGETILHLDENDYYGAESATLRIDQLWDKFVGEKFEKDDEKIFGAKKEYNIDLCPKFIMARGKLLNILSKTKVNNYMSFKKVKGSFVYKDKKVHKVPSTAKEGLKSSLMGFIQKNRFRGFMTYVQNLDVNNKATWKSYDPYKTTCAELFKAYKCDLNTQAFTGHAMALYTNDDYLNKPFLDMAQRIRMYAYSVFRFGGSAYIYPQWGLGNLPEGFSRLCAVHGGTFMLNRKVDEILFDDDGNVCGIKSNGETAKCKKIICSPSYILANEKLKHLVVQKGSVVRSVNFLKTPIVGTDNADSCQVIIPARQVEGRKSDIYVSFLGSAHKTTPRKRYIAMVNATVETTPEKAEAELKQAFALLGKPIKRITWTTPYYDLAENKEETNASPNNLFITRSYDATTHFETATTEVINLFEKVYGEPLDLSKEKEEQKQQDDK